MSTPAFQDLGARVVAIAQALASGADPSPDQLRDLLLGDVADEVERTASQIRSSLEELRDRAESRLETLRTEATAATEHAVTQLAQARSRLEEERDRAIATAEGAAEAAKTAVEQARATGEDELGEAERTRDAAVAAAEQAKRDAETTFTQAVGDLESRATEATEAADRLLAEAEQAAQDARAQVDTAVDEARAVVGRAADALDQLPDGLPDDVVALGEDALARLQGALSWPSGLLSLLAQALVWLKRTYFGDLHQLQVIWQEPPDGPGLGLLWLDGDQMVRLLYRPTAAPDMGAGTLLVETRGADAITFPGGPAADVSCTVTATGDQALVIGAGIAPPAGGPDTATLTVTFGALHFNQAFGPLTAVLEQPTLTVVLRHTGPWSYSVTLEVPKYGATLGLSDLLDRAGLPIPVTIPSIDELRSLTASLADGELTVKEAASA